MRDGFKGRQNVRGRKTHREKEDEDHRRGGAGFREQRVTGDSADMAVAVMSFHVRVPVKRNGGEKHKREGRAEEALRCFCPRETALHNVHLKYYTYSLRKQFISKRAAIV